MLFCTSKYALLLVVFLAMASVDTVFQLLKYRANKSGYNGSISSNDFNLVFPKAELRYYLKEFGNQNDYQYGSPIPRIAYPQTLKVSSSLSKFSSNPTTITIDGQGKYTKTSDLFFIDSISHVVTGGTTPTPIKRVEKQDLPDNLYSYYEFPTEIFPIYVEYATYIQFYPITLATATLTYLKAPTTTKWNRTLNGTISTLNTLVGGTSYVNGTYTNVALTGGSGNSAFATIVVAGGAVTGVTITNGGFVYKTSDTLSASNANLGGAGTGFSIRVATIKNAREVYTPTGSTDPQWADFDLDEIIYMALSDMGIFFKDNELEQFANGESKRGGIA